jgi:hypothetical protein
MDTGENEELTECCECGAEVVPAIDSAYVLDGAVLCFDCAVRRGGDYDAEEERWTVAPRVSDLPDERRPHP